MKRECQRNRKALSPIIATVLLVILVIIIAAIIFLWARRFVGEAVIKNGASAEQKCSEINLAAERYSETLSLNNNGNVPIYSVQLILKESGSEKIRTIEKINLAPGQSGEYPVPEIASAESAKITPIILGEVKSGTKEFTCTDIQINVES